MVQNVTIVLSAPSDPSGFNDLPPSASITLWEEQMQFYGQDKIDTPYEATGTRYDDERSPLYYDGSETYYNQSLYWTGRDNTYATGALSLSNHLWTEYTSVYGTLGPGSDGYRKNSQWVFGASADRKSSSHLEDMTANSSYSAYLDGHVDAYNDSDARGIGYLLDAYCRYYRNTSTNIMLAGRNQLEHLADIASDYCDNLGAVSPKTKEVFFQCGILGYMMMTNKDILDPLIATTTQVAKIVDYISDQCEVINTDQYRLKYGAGYIDDGIGGNEANAYYPGLEMVCVPMFKWFPAYQTFADGLWEYAVENVDLTLEKDYAEHYRFSIPYIMDR